MSLSRRVAILVGMVDHVTLALRTPYRLVVDVRGQAVSFLVEEAAEGPVTSVTSRQTALAAVLSYRGQGRVEYRSFEGRLFRTFVDGGSRPRRWTGTEDAPCVALGYSLAEDDLDGLRHAAKPFSTVAVYGTKDDERKRGRTVLRDGRDDARRRIQRGLADMLVVGGVPFVAARAPALEVSMQGDLVAGFVPVVADGDRTWDSGGAPLVDVGTGLDEFRSFLVPPFALSPHAADPSPASLVEVVDAALLPDTVRADSALRAASLIAFEFTETAGGYLKAQAFAASRLSTVAAVADVASRANALARSFLDEDVAALERALARVAALHVAPSDAATQAGRSLAAVVGRAQVATAFQAASASARSAAEAALQADAAAFLP